MGRADTSFDPSAAFATAIRLHQEGDLPGAEAAYRRLLANQPRHAQGLHLLGLVEHELGRLADAIAHIRAAIVISPAIAAMHASLGNILRETGDHAAAIAALETAIDLQPDFAEAHNGLGNALWAAGRLAEAAACFRRALHEQPALAEAHNNLGIALLEQGRLDLAEASFRQALALRPDDPKTLNNLGTLLVEAQRLDHALACYRQAIAINPDYLEARVNLGMTSLAIGDFATGWAEFDHRWAVPPLAAARRHAAPAWLGEPALGKTLLIHAEQGFGDTIQFCRYAPLAARRGLRVILQVQAPLVRLLRSLDGVAAVISEADDPPAFDLHCPTMSLPRAFATDLASIPAAPRYLRADPAAVTHWRARLGARFGTRIRPRIGLVWAGNPRRDIPQIAAVDRRRSIDPALLRPLFAIPGLQFVSLQKTGPAAPAGALTDFMTDITDFADTAALIENLDLVISVDSAVAHLAGALGKPVWLLNRFDSCWRWLTSRRDSPWYPTLRLYRQPAPHAWPAVIRHIAHDLSELAK